MKSPLRKLRGLKLHKRDSRDKRELMPTARLDELAEAAQDLDEMKNCYDSLVSAAAATANSAYEFSESLHDMGSCLLEYTSLHDEANDGIFLMLGKLQLELQKILDSYRAHIILTISNPSESLLNELRIVEDMKRHCDEKRNLYDYMVTKLRGGRSKSEKDGGYTLQQLQEAHAEFDNEANLFLFRLKSLKQGQSHCLLTQATRHHAAQLNFFRKGLKSLEAVESHVKLVTEEQHIDYYFNELDDNLEDGEDVRESGNYSNGCAESVELNEDDASSCEPSTTGNSQQLKQQTQAPGEANGTRHHRAGGSHSAPLFPAGKSDAAERARAMQQRQFLPRKSDTHVLPTPNEAGSVSHSRTRAFTIQAHNPWHSSPLEQKNKNPSSFQLPVPAPDGAGAGAGAPLPHRDQHPPSDHKNTKRQAFSDPVISKPWSTTRPVVSAPGPVHKPSSSSSSPPPSPPPPLMMSSPIISELHELPRPPENLQMKPDRFSASLGHSAPLFLRASDFSGTVRLPPSMAASKAAPLPAPPLAVCRSFSIPSTNRRTVAPRHYKLSDSASQFLPKDKPAILSPPPPPPPLQPLSFC